MGRVITSKQLLAQFPRLRRSIARRGSPPTAMDRVVASDWRCHSDGDVLRKGRLISAIYSRADSETLWKPQFQGSPFQISRQAQVFQQTHSNKFIRGEKRIKEHHNLIKILKSQTQEGVPYYLIYDDRGVLLKNSKMKLSAPYGTVFRVTRRGTELKYEFYTNAQHKSSWVDLNPYNVEGLNAVHAVTDSMRYTIFPDYMVQLIRSKRKSKAGFSPKDFYAFSLAQLILKMKPRTRDNIFFFACLRDAFLEQGSYLRMDDYEGEVPDFERFMTFTSRVMLFLQEDFIYFDWSEEEGLHLVPWKNRHDRQHSILFRLRRYGDTNYYVEFYNDQFQKWDDGRDLTKQQVQLKIEGHLRRFNQLEVIGLVGMDTFQLSRKLAERTKSAADQREQDLFRAELTSRSFLSPPSVAD